MATKTSPPPLRPLRPAGPGGNRPRFRFVTLWNPSLLGGLVVGAFAITGIAALALSQAATDNQQSADRRELRIMPLGDDLTSGLPTYAGAYRPSLWQKLVDQDRLNVDFVGSQSNGDTSLPDKDHEGHVGWTIDELNVGVAGWLQNYQPNVVLLHAGTTDLTNGATADAAAIDLDDLLATITATRTDLQVLVSSVGPLNVSGDWNSRAWQDYNAAIPTVVSKYRDKGYDVRFVDMADMAGLTKGSPDIADGVHLTAAGYGKMADVWYQSIKAR